MYSFNFGGTDYEESVVLDSGNSHYFGCKCLPFSVKNSMYNDEILKHIESLF